MRTRPLCEGLRRAGRDPLTSAPEFGELIRMAGEPLLADRIVEHAGAI